MRLAQGHVDARDIPDAEGDGIGVEARILERQVLGIRLDEADLAGKPPLLRPRLADAQHVGIDVGDGDFRIAYRRIEDPLGDVARAARHIQHAIG